MGLIKDKNKYPIKQKPNFKDYFIGSDSSNEGKTVNFEIGKIVSLISTAGQQNKIISGSPVWIPDTLSFYIPQITYILSGELHYTSPTTITLDNGGSLPRIDVIAVTIDDEVYVQKGVESPTPQKPTLPNGTDYLELTFVNIAAFGTVPDGVSLDLIYDENSGEPSEYTATEDTGGNGITLGYVTPEPFLGTKVIRVLRGTLADGTMTFTNDSTVPYNVSDYIQIAMLKHEIFSSGIKFEISLLNGSIAITNKLTINTGVFGFDNNILDEYQVLTIPFSYFTNSDVEYDKIQIKVTNIPYSEVYLDRIVRISGLVVNPPIGNTNLGYIAESFRGTVTSSTGTPAYIPLVNLVNAGLMSPSDKDKLDNVNLNIVEDQIVDGVIDKAPSQNIVHDYLLLKANDADVLHKTGDETKTGSLTLIGNITANSFIKTGGTVNDILLGNGTTALNSTFLHTTGNENFTGQKGFTNTDSVLATLTGIHNRTAGTLMTLQTGSPISNGILLSITSTSGTAVTNQAKLLVLNSGTDSIGMPFSVQLNGTDKATIDKNGNLTAVSGTFSGNVIGATPTLTNHLVTKAYADGLVVGLLDDRGSYNASSNLFPTTGGSGTGGVILKGDIWYVSVAGTLGGKPVAVGDSFRALVDSPAQVASNWGFLSSNIGYVPANDALVVHLAGTETITGLKTFTQALTANSFVKTGGTSTQFLKADGSIDSSVYSLDSNVVHKTGNEVISGVKSFSNSDATLSVIAMTTSNTTTAAITVSNSGSFRGGINGTTSGSGGAIYGSTTGTGSAIVADNSQAGATGLLFEGISTSRVYSVDKSGNVTANSFIKTGGTSSQFLMADGSVNSGVFLDGSTGAIQGFAITNNGNGTVNIASGTAYLKATNDPYAPLVKYTIPAVTNLALTDNANNYILVDYNGGSPALTVTTNTAIINTETNSLAIVISRVGTILDYVSLVGQNVDSNAKLRIRFLNQEGIRRANGAGIGFSSRNLTLTAGTLFSGLIRLDSPAFNTGVSDTFTQVYFNGTSWIRTTGQTQVNNTQYNNGGVLTNLGNNDYRTDYIYLLPNNPSKLYLVLGTTSYTNLTAARTAPIPSSLPSELQSLGVLVGRSIIQRLGTSITEVSSAFDVVFSDSSVPNHNDLSGIQGGATGDYQHLTTAEKALVIGSVQGSGTVNLIPKFTGSGAIGNSQIFDNGTNVGLGTSSPSSKLEIVSSVNNDGIGFKYSPSIGNSKIGVTFDSGGDAGNNMTFSVSNASNVAVERMRILGNGNVAIGTTSPYSDSKFSVKTATDHNFGLINRPDGIIISSYNDAVNANMVMEYIASKHIFSTGDVVITARTYANDAAADADSTLSSGSIYRITGSRTAFIKP